MAKRKPAPPVGKDTASRSKQALPETAAIVGIGASAGGLEACTALFQSLPADTGMAFALVQHLDPDHESNLVPLLARTTQMPVVEARQGTQVAPNHVYVIPRNRDLTVSRGRIQLTSLRRKHQRHMPIDTLFQSLAAEKGERAIGVVLSGGDSDGTLGLEAIKAEGGITFAQDAKSAKQPVMPRNAVATGCVDFVLPPEKIALELARFARHPYLGKTKEAPVIDGTLRKILGTLHSVIGVDFTGYRQTTIARRITRRMALRKIENPEAYAAQLRKDAAEARALYEDILIHVTQFFREPEVFETLRAKIAPALIAGKKKDEPVRIWVPGCASGEEVYSIAIVLLEAIGDRLKPPLQVFGTDLSEQAVERARIGTYSGQALTHVSAERLSRFFVTTSDGHQIAKPIRDLCVFARHDLVQDPPFSRLDLISCRNVLIYMEPDLQRKVIDSFHYALRPDGHLLLGRSESVGPRGNLFTLADQKNRIYIRKAATAPRGRPAGFSGLRIPAAARTERETVAFDFRKEVARIFTDRYLPAALVVDADLHILEFHGDTGPFLKPQAGTAALDLLKMVREDIIVDLRTLIHRAKKEDATTKRAGVRFRAGNEERETDLEVVPIQGRNGGAFGYLVVFGPVERKARPAPTSASSVSEGRRKEVEHLRQELTDTRKFLRAAIEDLETANEELRAANEESLSNNEELQSTNEELETAKEEMQSANEELSTLNEELHVRNLELGELNHDLHNLLLNIQIPVAILGPDRRIRHFTPAAEKLLNLIPGDAGRPIGDIRPNINMPEFGDMISSVMAKGAPEEREVQDRSGRWYSLRMRPYRVDNRVEGLVLVLLDIDALKRSSLDFDLARSQAQTIVEMVDLPLVVLDRELRVENANRAFYRLFHMKPAECERRDLFELTEGVWKTAPLRSLLTGVLAGRHRSHETEIEGTFPAIGRRRIALSAQPLERRNGRTRALLLVLEDVTERRNAEEALLRSESTTRATFEGSTRAILCLNSVGNIVLANPRCRQIFGYRPAHLVGTSIEALLPPGDRAVHHARFFTDPARGTMAFNVEMTGLRRNGSEFAMEVSVSPVETRSGRLSIVFVSDVSERRKGEELLRSSEARLRMSQKQLRTLAAGLFKANEEERRRLSRELHDDLNQQLAMLTVEVESIELLIPELEGPVLDRLHAVRDRAAKISDGVRRTAYQLHPSTLEHLGLVATLKSLCADFRIQHAMEVHFRSRKVPKSLPDPISLCLYRVAQQCLSNVLAHSGQLKATMTLIGTASRVRLMIQDQGAGFDLEAPGRQGLGIVSMEERVRLVGGTMLIQSQLGGGVCVDVTIPMPGKASRKP